MNKNQLYLDDYSNEDIINKNIYQTNEKDDIDTDTEYHNKTDKNKPSISMKSNYNSKGEKVVVFSVNIPLKKNGLKIDILINDEMYKNIGKYF